MRDKDKDAWVLDFIDEVDAHLDEPLPRKFARTLALSQWTTNQDRPPAVVAREWVKARPKPEKR